jgi:1-acyl-sn-glycerol-3-phosphate acyltransferase
MNHSGAKVLWRRSPLLCRLFRVYLRRYFRRHFTAVRISRAGAIPVIPDGPLLIVSNHPSWWDPLVGFLLASQIGRALYAPMAAAALDRYRLFRRLGVFGVEEGRAAGARSFLQVGTAILETAGTALAVTPQGRFADPRERPMQLMPGAGHLVRHVGRGTILPVALEYPFWNERLPEALVYCGRPIPITPTVSSGEWTNHIAAGLERAQDALSAEASRRDPAAFRTLLNGRVGIGGVYDSWRRVAALATGRRFRGGHGAEGNA